MFKSDVAIQKKENESLGGGEYFAEALRTEEINLILLMLCFHKVIADFIKPWNKLN